MAHLSLMKFCTACVSEHYKNKSIPERDFH